MDELLLPGVEGLADAELGFAWRWATGWLAAQTRLAPPATRSEGVVVFEATGPCDPDALHTQALELALRRRGLRTLVLPVTVAPERVACALHAVAPEAVVLTGRHTSLDALGRLVFAARRAGSERVTVVDFRGALPETGASTVVRLDRRAAAAADELLARFEGAPATPRPVGLRAVAGGA